MIDDINGQFLKRFSFGLDSFPSSVSDAASRALQESWGDISESWLCNVSYSSIKAEKPEKTEDKAT